MLDIIYLTTRT